MGSASTLAQIKSNPYTSPVKKNDAYELNNTNIPV